MNRSLALLAGLCLLFGPLSTTDAAVWHRTPGSVTADNAWLTTGPHEWLGPGLNDPKAQRDVYLDFSPVGNPGELTYVGTHDSLLKSADSVALTNIGYGHPGGVIPVTVPVSPTSSQVARMASTGSNAIASIEITLGNLGSSMALKEIWIEWVSTSLKPYNFNDGEFLGTDYYPTVSPGSSVVLYAAATPVQLKTLTGYGTVDEKWWVHNVLVRLSPSPALETIAFNVPETGSLDRYFIDTIHIATNAIPEPGTLLIWSALAGLAVGLVGWRPAKS